MATEQSNPDPDTEMSNAPPPPPPSSSSAQPSPPPPPSQPQPQPPASDDAAADPENLPDSSPENPAPKQLTPGPRAARLQALFAQTAKHTLDKITKDNFGACFPTIAAKAPGTLDNVQRQMVDRLGGLWTKEFDRILESRDVVAKLNELEVLVGDAQRRRQVETEKPIPPHTLPAPIVLAAHLAEPLAETRAALTTKLSETQAQNNKLFEEIQAQRAEMEALLSGVEKTLKDIDGANGLLAELMDEVAEETRAAEGDIGRYAPSLSR
ncbi:Nnf1-domain-containing protein [Podospora australis]|uniref:Nnf1-domain-containing protein n=1 Tax=Podospora australis TaxID=1536484 RepID=A0AAN6X2G1_9PEZI|nr:Nnf1-domain-containing protein [Podospora australis]